MELAVESLPGRKDRPATFGSDFPGFTALYNYWQSVRRGDAIPRSADFDLLALTNWLPDMSLLDVRDADTVIWRFAGTTIVERMGYDPSGENVLHSQAKNLLDRAARAYRMVTSHPCGGLSYYTNHYSSGREGNVHTLYLPLEAPSGQTSRLVSLTIREENGVFAEPIERTITGTNILSLDWIDLGFGVPAQEN
ncbi:MAG: PAS domain-containing protein [Parvibaculum sp.]|uniref:PAS domain-containing protein n=1 Tax=Parvibaculum sp. TaxID=2024848 RepID=UPI0025CDB2A5|nr:PAS domain-containing protein [Parvibaculum sp.]MCE9648766.1 PAS domain-containing protein [Parvibaculum sp.]